jgi:hypothetical protein
MVESALHGDMQTPAEMTGALSHRERGNRWKYTDPTAMFNAEVGRIEQVRFMDTNHDRAAARVGNAGVLGEGFVFGKEAIAFALAKELGTYVTPPQGHAGRFRAISWYGIIGFRMIWEDSANPGEANVVHVGSL